MRAPRHSLVGDGGGGGSNSGKSVQSKSTTGMRPPTSATVRSGSSSSSSRKADSSRWESGRADSRRAAVHRRDPRQQTLTQIDFVARIPPPSPPELELELETVDHGAPSVPSVAAVPLPPPPYKEQHLQNASPPRKRKRVAVDPAVPKGVPVTASSHSSRPPLAEKIDYTGGPHPSDVERDSSGGEPPQTSTSDEDGAGLSLQTPKHAPRTFVPSSQSPDVTPLSMRSGGAGRIEQLASPTARRDLIMSPSTPRFYTASPNGNARSWRRHATDTQVGGLVLAEDSQETGDSARPLRLEGSDISAGFAPSNRLEASPNAPLQSQHECNLRQRGRTKPPARQSPNRQGHAVKQSSSQAAASKAKSLPEHGDSDHQQAHKLSSQATTQDPTQQLSDTLPPPPLLSRSPGGKKESLFGRPWIDYGRAEPPNSSQATTVLPSSVANLPTPKLHRSNRLIKDEPTTTPPHLGSSPTASLARYQWDAKELTDSQLLPDSLMNWSIPMPPSLHSDFETSEEEGGDEGSAADVPRRGREAVGAMHATTPLKNAVPVKKETVDGGGASKAATPRPTRKGVKTKGRLKVKKEPVD